MIQPAELRRLRGIDHERKLAELMALGIILDWWQDPPPFPIPVEWQVPTWAYWRPRPRKRLTARRRRAMVKT